MTHPPTTTSYTTIDPWNGTTSQMAYVPTALTSPSAPLAMPVAKPPAKPSVLERIKARAESRRAKREERRQNKIRASVLPKIAGGAPESEVEKRIEAKKKVILKRTVGIERDKGSGLEATHTGTVELVRDLEGDPHQRSTVGIKVVPNGNSYVEIPLTMLREALDELDPKDVLPDADNTRGV